MCLPGVLLPQSGLDCWVSGGGGGSPHPERLDSPNPIPVISAMETDSLFSSLARKRANLGEGGCQ